MRNERGFTLIEMLIVMTLIITLAGLATANYRSAIRHAEEAALKADLFHMRDAMDQYYSDKNKWPSDLSELVTEGYIRAVPVDPMTKSKDTWVAVMAESDPSNPAAAGGIANVKSGSDRVALDGTHYSTDW